jgi:hypothetical protein
VQRGLRTRNHAQYGFRWSKVGTARTCGGSDERGDADRDDAVSHSAMLESNRRARGPRTITGRRAFIESTGKRSILDRAP